MKHQKLIKTCGRLFDLYFPNQNTKVVYVFLFPLVFTGSLLSGILIVFIQRLLSPVCLIRLGRFTSTHLGHYILEYDWYQSAKNPSKKNVIDLFFLRGEVCNNFLDNLVKSRTHIVNSSLFLGAYIFNKLVKSKKYLVDLPVRPTDLTFLDEAKVNIEFSKSQSDLAKNTLGRLGIRSDSKIVCIFVRDAGHSGFQGFPSAGDSSAYRNCDIDNYMPAINFLSDQGYTVVRMGRNVIKPLTIADSKIIDYANSDLQNDLLDFYITSICEFAICTDSGSNMLPIAFRKPILLTNISALHGLIDSIFLKFFQFKEWRNLENKKIGLLEFLNPVFLEVDNQANFDRLGISFIENSESEILNLVKEYLSELNSNKVLEVDPNSQLLVNILLEHSGRSVSGKLCNYWLSKRPYFLLK